MTNYFDRVGWDEYMFDNNGKLWPRAILDKHSEQMADKIYESLLKNKIPNLDDGIILSVKDTIEQIKMDIMRNETILSNKLLSEKDRVKGEFIISTLQKILNKTKQLS